MLKIFYILLLGTIAPSLHSESGNPFVSGFYFMEKEIWMPIHGAHGFEISTNFRFRSWNAGNPKGKFIRDKPTILKPSMSSNGYLTVSVKMDGNERCGELVHRLIAKHFMIDWMAILMSIPITGVIVFLGFMFLQYPFINDKEKTVLKTFIKWYKQLK